MDLLTIAKNIADRVEAESFKQNAVSAGETPTRSRRHFFVAAEQFFRRVLTNFPADIP